MRGAERWRESRKTGERGTETKTERPSATHDITILVMCVCNKHESTAE